MVKRNTNGSLFVGEVVEEVKKEQPVVEQPSLGEIMGDTFLIDEVEEKPKNKAGRPKRK